MNEIYDAYSQQGCGEVCFPLRTAPGDGYPIMFGDGGGTAYGINPQGGGHEPV